MKTSDRVPSREEIENSISVSKSERKACMFLNIPRSRFRKLVAEYDLDCSKFNHGRVYEELLNKRFGMLTVSSVDLSGRRKYATCQCDCGKEKNVRCDSLKDGKYISCGCHSSNRLNVSGNKNHAFSGCGELGSCRYNEIKVGAKRRKLEFDVTIEYLWSLFEDQDAKCSVTNMPIKFGRVYVRHETTASLDRIDNNKGYIKGNVRWVHKDINMMRGPLDKDYFLLLCNAVSENNRRDISQLFV